MNTGVVGLGDMGSGLAKNLIKSGFPSSGFDLSESRMKAFSDLGGSPAASVKDLARKTDVAFVMVMTGDQAKSVILGDDGLAANMPKGSVIILTATIKPNEATEIGKALNGTGIGLVDSPVSGGFPGAQGGTLTMMAAGSDADMKTARPAMEAISSTIWKVGDQPGQGQTVKACLQSLLGAMFSATFEAAAMAAKAGISGQAFYNVVANGSGGCTVTKAALENIIDRKFEGTGSHIATMHKDLTISMNLGEQLGVPLHTAAAAMQIFHAGKTKYPDGDNWVCTRVIEEIVGAELHRDGARQI
ncbi:MAG: NAD(P)-dependent oxidoreductase [Rhodobacteraceae bacterium]|nr:NAD(P)-dependent oxidoreductase [Paracoccaceae bacterium]NCW54271.1 NAD(P)-dependent oxidoreductase [Paracoccaceae bacterium]NDD08846.1 NAD(P)-dependent oxidoreductase [Paracoccaceae bacterium]NDH25456.1 NAD(P)-dependent oxidoreductase [Paracoccaceae bacterium]